MDLKSNKIKPAVSALSSLPGSRLDSPLDLRGLGTDVIIRHLEDTMKVREMSLTDRLKKGMLR